MLDINLEILNSDLKSFYSNILLVIKNISFKDITISEIGFADREKNQLYKAATAVENGDRSDLLLQKNEKLSIMVDTEMLDRKNMAFIYVRSDNGLNYYANRSMVSLIDE